MLVSAGRFVPDGDADACGTPLCISDICRDPVVMGTGRVVVSKAKADDGVEDVWWYRKPKHMVG